MADFNPSRQTLTIKLVYYGPTMSGKTTNLMRLHDLLTPQLKGEMMALETQNDRTLYFDLFPLGFRTASGLTVTARLLTVPGHVVHDGTRKAVLSRADGVVFVADSKRSQDLTNAESFDNLEQNAGLVGLDFERLPLVVQFNKRDLPDIVPESSIRAKWAPTPWPVQFSTALTGLGVLETFRTLVDLVYRSLNQRYNLTEEHNLSSEQFRHALMGTVTCP